MTDSEILCELVINLGVFPKNEMSELLFLRIYPKIDLESA